MNKIKLLTLAIIGLLVLNLATLAFLFLHHSAKGPIANNRPGEGPKNIIIERLHFNQTQQNQYNAMVDEHRSRSRELRDNSKLLHDKLYALLNENPVNEIDKNKLITNIAENQKLTEELNFTHFRQIRSLCKGVQIKYFNELVEDLGKLFAPQHPPK